MTEKKEGTGRFNPAVFLDRDGVINEDSPDYITRLEAFVFLTRSLEAIARLTRAGWSVFVVTNQSAVNRGYMTLQTLSQIHEAMRRQVAAAGGRITDIFFCPHRPEEGCSCRKPRPGMLFGARERYGLDLSRAVMVGDRGSDIACGRNAGCGAVVRVGDVAPMAEDPLPDHLAPNLFDAVTWILSRHAGP